MFKSVRLGGRGATEVLVVGQFKGGKVEGHAADKLFAEALARGEATGDVGRIVEVFPQTGARGKGPNRTIIVGLGDKASCNAETFRTIAGAIGRRLAQTRETRVEIDRAGACKAAGMDIQRAGCALGEGFGLIGWNYDRCRGSATPKSTATALEVRAADKHFAAGLERGLALAESANLARSLSQTPPNIATTEFMAAEARKLARQLGLKCTILQGSKLDEEKLIGLKAVGAASDCKPCLIRLEYTPRGASRSGKPAVLVGKTMTYDSGGLSLKINNGMVGMKRDKDGGCAVFGAMHAIATVIKPNRRVVALLSVAENSISDEAYRPDDVITFRNGVTVEVTNTDAEGRLVLADALCWACDKEDPAFIIDLATLTGGVVVALGSTYAGMWCDDDKLRRRVEDASEASGERVAPPAPRRVPRHDEVAHRRHPQQQPQPQGPPHPGRRLPELLRREGHPLVPPRHRRRARHRERQGSLHRRPDGLGNEAARRAAGGVKAQEEARGPAKPGTGGTPQPLCFVHIPKTAGTTFHLWLESRFARHEICPARELPHLLRLPRESLGAYQLFSGHLGLFPRALLGTAPWMVTLLRDPLSRSVSHYRDIRSRPTHPLFSLAQQLSLERFLRTRPGAAEICNLQCRYLALEDIDDFHSHARLSREDPAALRARYSNAALLDRAFHNTERFGLVGLSERVDEAAAELARRWGWPAPAPLGRENAAKGPFSSEDLTPAAIEIIRELTAFDQRLYDQWCERAASWPTRSPGRGTPSHISS
ncbi:MAG: hypothetical protein IPJ41_04600 [Phycisphaerales bacterium]|nr:hypothetical protein [Phycisphaerales bacterium]